MNHDEGDEFVRQGLLAMTMAEDRELSRLFQQGDRLPYPEAKQESDIGGFRVWNPAYRLYLSVMRGSSSQFLPVQVLFELTYGDDPDPLCILAAQLAALIPENVTVLIRDREDREVRTYGGKRPAAPNVLYRPE